MKVAAVQLCSQADVDENLAAVEQQVSACAAVGATLVVLPEAFSYFGPDGDKAGLAESLAGDGKVVSRLRALCRRHALTVVAGGILEKSPDPARPYNTSAVFDQSGDLIASYRKMHLFDVSLDDGTTLRESRTTHPGGDPVVAHVGDTKIGLSICYDVRFPELFAWQRAHGAEIITVPSAFTHTTGSAHWHVLLRARAIETQCFVIAAAQEGTHPLGRRTFGHALIIDPWGRIMAERTEPGAGIALADLDLNEVARARRQIPVAEHRRDVFR